MLIGLGLFFLAPTIGAWLLSQTSRQVMSSYHCKMLFLVAIGLLIAIFADLTSFGIGGYPAKDAVLLAANHLIAWTLVGLVVAWRITPDWQENGNESDRGS